MEKYRRIENSSALSKMYTNTAWYEESKKKDSIKKERPKHLAKKKSLYLQENTIETGVKQLSNSVIYDLVKDDQHEHLK